MIEPICECGTICIFLKKEIRNYSYPLHARSHFMIKGKEMVYLCTNPKKVKHYPYITTHELKHEEKFRMCKFKTTNILNEYFGDKQKC